MKRTQTQLTPKSSFSQTLYDGIEGALCGYPRNLDCLSQGNSGKQETDSLVTVLLEVFFVPIIM